MLTVDFISMTDEEDPEAPSLDKIEVLEATGTLIEL